MALPLADRKANVEANRKFASLQDALGCIFEILGEKPQKIKVSHTHKGEQDSITAFQICMFLRFAMQYILVYHLLIGPPTEGNCQFLVGDVRRPARQGASNII